MVKGYQAVEDRNYHARKTVSVRWFLRDKCFNRGYADYKMGKWDAAFYDSLERLDQTMYERGRQYAAAGALPLRQAVPLTTMHSAFSPTWYVPTFLSEDIMKLTALIILVMAQFTIVPFIAMMGHNEAPQIVVKGNIVYKNG